MSPACVKSTFLRHFLRLVLGTWGYLSPSSIHLQGARSCVRRGMAEERTHTRGHRRPCEQGGGWGTLKQGPILRPLSGFGILKAVCEQTFIGSRELSCRGFPSSQILKPERRFQLGLTPAAPPERRDRAAGAQGCSC